MSKLDSSNTTTITGNGYYKMCEVRPGESGVQDQVIGKTAFSKVC